MSFADAYAILPAQNDSLNKIREFVEQNDLTQPEMELIRFEVETQPEFHGLVFITVDARKKGENLALGIGCRHIRHLFMIHRHGYIWSFDTQANRWFKGKKAFAAQYLNSFSETVMDHTDVNGLDPEIAGLLGSYGG